MAVREAEPVGSLQEVKEVGLDREDLLGIYRNMLITRGIEERGHILYKQGKIPGSFYTGRGNEASAVGVATRDGRRTTSAARCTATWACTSRAASSRGAIFAQYMGREDGPTRGRDGNVHIGDARLGLHAMVSHLPAMLPVAIGMALAFRIREERRVAVGWFGEGAAARGDAHEGMNLAGVRQLPIVFVCDNNQWAYSTPTYLGYAVEHIADRAAAYGFEGVVVDGTDVLAVYREAKRAIEKAREGGGPTLIECLTLRMEGHAVHDDAFYVPQRDVRGVGRSATRSSASAPGCATTPAMTDDEEDEITAGVKKLLNDALERAEESPLPDPATLLDGVFADARGPRHPPPQVAMAEKTYLQAISDGLRQEMRRDQRVFVLGEDVGVYGGAFKVTHGFQEEFGPWRVIDTPLSETAIVGGATGAALMGLRPVAEMQFADFVSCAWDHLVTVAAKQYYRAGTPIPIVVRLPSGGGFSGGPFHSQNPESLVRAHPGPQGRLPGDAGGREGPARERDRGPEPGPLLRAQAPLPPDQGRGARRALHDAVRQGARPPARATTSSS